MATKVQRVSTEDGVLVGYLAMILPDALVHVETGMNVTDNREVHDQLERVKNALEEAMTAVRTIYSFDVN